MGCSSSAVMENQSKRSDRVASQADELARTPSPFAAIKAAILIQGWYRRYVARMEMRRRYTWSIFQSIEYSGEQDQLQLSHFFSFLMNHYVQSGETGGDWLSHLLTPSGHPGDNSDTEQEAEYESINVPDSYTGPRLSFPLTVADASTLLKTFKQQQLHGRYVLQLLHETRKTLKQMPNITHISTCYSKEITICGDLHGKLDDLMLIFYKNGLPSPEKPYVFNGDFVDRGKNSLEVIIILFAFLLIYPNDVHLNRGNHEDHIVNLRYGFTKEVMQKYKACGKKILRLVQDVFSWLPLATIVDSKVLVVHGGISDTTDLDFLASIDRHRFKSALRSQARALENPNEKSSTNLCLKAQTSSRLDKNGNVRRKLPETSSISATDPSSFRKQRLVISSHSSGSSLSRSDGEQDGGKEEGVLQHYSNQERLPDGGHRFTPILEVSCLDCEVAFPNDLLREEMEWKQIVDILWSDPRNFVGCIPNSFRGGGCYFGHNVTESLLRRYDLELLIRSHECKQEGYELCHNRKVITIFSASNYYEEGSNRGAYIKLGPNRVPRFVQYRVSKSTRKLTLRERVSVVEASALKSLREKFYAHKSEVIDAFKQYDKDQTGKISTSQWASAVESVLHLHLPWRTLRSRLVRVDAEGSVDYLSSFEDLQIEQPMKEVQPNLIETLYRHRADLEIIFGMIDKDHSGMISIEEFRQTWKLFSSHLHVNLDDECIDGLARSIDFNKDGSIDFNEFLEAFRLVQKDNQ
ncbi:serine/threonine-protein phosphatase with EF-hands 1 isoform X2 [Stegostoma tigrinum]|uniref:serine/threonine-protein phosphatase with EF-hands 1 isoform X2 n=1 Tax=Stegostoma tigrinum TaxID=3053191 RepID=UPI00286FF816|nr:serine/threonine-protein phosphatase with EF-hands 1 isoform X2 [Stegostoma tigrinum]